MHRRALTRGSVAAATVVVLATGLAPAVGGGTAYADGSAQETVVPAGSRWLPRTEPLKSAGNDGFMLEESDGYRWVTTADGSEGPAVPAPPFLNTGLSAQVVHSSPALAVAITDHDSGTFRTITAPAGQDMVQGAFGSDSVVSTETAADGTLIALHVISGGQDRPADQVVTGLPAGTAVPGTDALLAQNRDGAVLRLTSAATPGTAHTYLLDYRTATAREIFADVPAAGRTTVVLGRDRVLAYGGAATTAYTVRLDDPAATVERTPVPAGDDGEPAPLLATTGDRILVLRRSADSHSAGGPLTAVPVGGGTAKTLLAAAATGFATAPDGTVLAEGGAGPDDWAVRRIGAAPGADATVTDLKALPPVAARIQGLSYSAGRLVYSTDTTSQQPLLRRDVTVSADAAPVVGAPKTLWPAGPEPADCGSGVSCVHLRGLGDGTVAFASGARVLAPDPVSTTASRSVRTDEPGTVVDASGPYVTVGSGAPARQRTFDLDHPGDAPVTLPVTASALWGHTLWTPGATTGTVRPYDLVTGVYGAAVQTGAPCVPKELQADGRWLYWSCGAGAGVYDQVTHQQIPVPTGDALLGDGYLVRHDAAAGRLMVTDVHDGKAVTSNLAELDASPAGDDRGISWTVDKYGGGVAYADPQQRIHVLPLTAVPRSPVSVLTGDIPRTSFDVLADPAGTGWEAAWTLSRPVAGWTLTTRDEAGKAVTSRTGAAGTKVSTSWNLRDTAGRPVPNGHYTWTLSGQPADGGAGALSASGRIDVTGSAGVHDFTGDRTGDLFGLTPAGRLDLRAGNGKGNVNAARSTSGWPLSSTYVPFGDLGQDRVNDLLVRDSSGKLWRYDGKAGTNFSPSQPRTLIGPGWNAYNALVPVGDMTGDGRADLVARTPAGALYLYAAGQNGAFGPRTLIGPGWDRYSLLIGSQNSGRLGGRQLLARDTSGVLWAYNSDGKGHFAPRVKIGPGWNIYGSIVGTGDLTPSVTPSGTAYVTDLVARDAAGVLWRYSGQAGGTGFAARVKLGPGWQMYASLF